MADLTYTQLTKAVTELTAQVIKSSAAIQVRAQQLEDDAADTLRTAEAIAAMRVDKATVGETRELSKIMKGLSTLAISYASAGTTTARMAKAAGDEAAASHSEFYEAATRSIIGNDLYDVDRHWFEQE